MGLVLVSHSGMLVDGLRDMVAQVAGDDVPVATAGGTEDGRLGTSAPRIADAIRRLLDAGADDALVLLDLGSAALSLELALEDLEADDRARVRISEAPLVEGAILAAVQASIGARSTRSSRQPKAPRPWPSYRGPDDDGRDPPHRHRPVRAARPAGGPVRPGGEPLRQPDRHPPGRPRGRREEPDRPARADDPPVVRDHPRGRRPRRRRRPRRPRRGTRPLRRSRESAG